MVALTTKVCVASSRPLAGRSLSDWTLDELIGAKLVKSPPEPDTPPVPGSGVPPAPPPPLAEPPPAIMVTRLAVALPRFCTLRLSTNREPGWSCSTSVA